MNKYQEALDGLKENIENITGTRIETDEDFYGWIDTLQELVDKETPKKYQLNTTKRKEKNHISNMFALIVAIYSYQE